MKEMNKDASKMEECVKKQEKKKEATKMKEKEDQKKEEPRKDKIGKSEEQNIDISNKKTDEKEKINVVRPMKSKEQMIKELKEVYKPNESIGKKLKRKFD